jgi:hypothetical protein
LFNTKIKHQLTRNILNEALRMRVEKELKSNKIKGSLFKHNALKIGNELKSNKIKGSLFKHNALKIGNGNGGTKNCFYFFSLTWMSGLACVYLD